MKKIFTIILGIVLLIFAFAAINALIRMGSNRADKFNASLDSGKAADDPLSSMSVEEKVGQLMLIGVHGNALNDDMKYLLNTQYAGGVILFDRNIESKEQLRALTSALQEANPSPVPLFIGIDEEGGEVVRGSHIIEPPPSQRQLGEWGRVDLVTTWAERTARSMRELGINLNLAPVVDIADEGLMYNRTYGTTPERVTNFASAALSGYKAAKIYAVLKHFPGIGRGLIDSHDSLSHIKATREELARDIAPYQALIKNNLPASGVMILTSHFVYDAYDAENPASMSAAIQQKLLRKELQYTGLILSDDLEMGAASENIPVRELGVRAILAGADIVLVCHEYDNMRDVYEGLVAAVRSGAISEERLNESVERVLAYKELYLKDKK